MAKATLVNIDVELGDRILGALDAGGFSVTAALWLLTDEFEDWRLAISTPLYDKVGPQEAYLKLVTALSSREPNLSRPLPIRLMSNRSALIRELRRLFKKSADVRGMRLGGHMIGDVWIDDAYVYLIR